MLMLQVLFILACLLVQMLQGFKNISPRVVKNRFNGVGRFASSVCEPYGDFLKQVAKVDPPQRLSGLLDILKLQGHELLNPRERAGLNPLLIPLAKDPSDQSIIGFMRWPTQKESMPLQVVKTNEIGLTLLALDTDSYCLRQAVELDIAGDKRAGEVLALADPPDNKKFPLGYAANFINITKLPKTTEENRQRLNLDRFLLLKVGSFLDSYRRLAFDYYALGNELNALITCERAVNVFFGWGSPMTLHMQMLAKTGRADEARDSAKAVLANPKFTLCDNSEELNEIVRIAGYSNLAVLGDMHAFRSTDPRQKEVEEGLTKEQVLLDQAAHLMDAVALGRIEGGWDAARKDIAQRYFDGGYPDVAKFIETVK